MARILITCSSRVRINLIFFRVSTYFNTIKMIMSWEGGNVLGGVSKYDMLKQVLWVQGTAFEGGPIQNYVIDVNNGHVILNQTNTFNLEAITFDYPTGYFIAIGEETDGSGCTVVRVNTTSGESTIISTRNCGNKCR